MSDVVRLTAKTKKGKEKIRRWGELWIIVGRSSQTTTIMIVSQCDESRHTKPLADSARWVNRYGDDDFIVEVIL